MRPSVPPLFSGSRRLVLILLILWPLVSACQPVPPRTDREILGLLGPVTEVEVWRTTGRGSPELLERWRFRSEGTLSSREIFRQQSLFFHPLFLLDYPGEERFQYTSGELTSIQRPLETETFQKEDKGWEAQRRDRKGSSLGRRQLVRDYRGDLIEVLTLDPQGTVENLMKISYSKEGRPLAVSLHQPSQDGELQEKWSRKWRKDGLPEGVDLVLTDSWGNWVSARWEPSLLSRTIKYAPAAEGETPPSP